MEIDIPILVDNKKFPNNCINTYINPVKDFLKKENLEKLYQNHISGLKDKDIHVNLYIYGMSYFNINVKVLKNIEELIENHRKEISNIVIELSPNDITFKNLRLLRKKQITEIELLAYTTNDRANSLVSINHSFRQTKKACFLLKLFRFNFKIVQLVGMPDMSYQENIRCANNFLKLKPNGIKLHELYVTKNSILEKLYNQDMYKVYSVEKTIDMLNEIIQVYSEKLEIIEFGFSKLYGEEKFYDQVYNEIIDIGVKKDKQKNQNNKKVVQVGKLNKKTRNTAIMDFGSNIVAGTYKENLKELIEENMWYDAISSKIKKLNSKVSKILIKINEGDYTSVIGVNKNNYKKLSSIYDLEIDIDTDEAIKKGHFKLEVLEKK